MLASLIRTLIGVPMHEDFALDMERPLCIILPARFLQAASIRGDLKPGGYGLFSLSVHEDYSGHAIDAIKPGMAHAQGKK